MLDSNDLKLISKLMDYARTTWAELGAMVGLSAPAAAERVRKLEERNVIRGYAAILDPEAVGLGLAAFVSVTLEHPRHRRGFLQAVANTPAIQECHHIAGDEDYILKVRCTGTRQLEELVSNKLKSIEGVTKTKTTVILSTVKETPRLPLEQ
ncbi:asnc bacterial regulatory protein hth signature [Lucifera butyrica]|uniref:Asnc bacterial regulatory protein hth signature n=1 Tax=Lucifera butyrica TaxID=1351585 RepID=A0A498R3C6_9FIRM|nr:Lrp/AsnC family transcriptional regulator [Lucifera butyrica]VBB05347.1 asnc bacterial regulatory protein hth signature [Lucifera butyrica]